MTMEHTSVHTATSPETDRAIAHLWRDPTMCRDACAVARDGGAEGLRAWAEEMRADVIGALPGHRRRGVYLDVDWALLLLDVGSLDRVDWTAVAEGLEG